MTSTSTWTNSEYISAHSFEVRITQNLRLFSLQYYLPPKTQVNKDFLKQVFTEEKQLLKKKKVDPVEVPAYDELSVKNLWPQFMKDKAFVRYFPDKFADGKGPARKYFFDVLNTLYPEYLAQIMAHANEVRWTTKGPEM